MEASTRKKEKCMDEKCGLPPDRRKLQGATIGKKEDKEMTEQGGNQAENRKMYLIQREAFTRKRKMQERQRKVPPQIRQMQGRQRRAFTRQKEDLGKTEGKCNCMEGTCREDRVGNAPDRENIQGRQMGTTTIKKEDVGKTEKVAAKKKNIKETEESFHHTIKKENVGNTEGSHHQNL